MRRFILCLALLCPSFSWGTDLTASVNTEGNQLYNKGFRDIKDGTNGVTTDVVSANTFTLVTTTGAVKATGGYLEGFIVNATCASNFVYIHDSATFPGSTVISSFTATIGFYPVKARFSNGLSVGVSPTCTSGVTFIYR